MSRFRRIADIVGRVLIGVGVLLLLFTAYQVWGTSIEESHAQAALRSQLRQQSVGTGADQALSAAATRGALPTGPPDTAPSTPDPAEGTPVGEVRIPAIGLDQIVVEGSGEADLRKGPGHYLGTPLPGQHGNVAIAGHRTTYGHPFYSLDALKVGDPIVLTTLQGVFVYEVTKGPFVVSPNRHHRGEERLLQHDHADDVQSALQCLDPTDRPGCPGPHPVVLPRLGCAPAWLRGCLGGPPTRRAPCTPAWPVIRASKWPPPSAGEQPSSPSACWCSSPSSDSGSTGGWSTAPDVAAALVLLWFFFGALSPLLPASF